MIGFCGPFHLHDFYNSTNPSSVNSLNSSYLFLNTIILQSDISTTALNAQRIFSGLGIWVFLVSQTVKNPSAMQEIQVQSLVQKIPWRREWLPTPIFLPGEFHGQRSLTGYSPWGHIESNTTNQLTFTYLPLPFII